ncbi:hypothetical protein FRC14_004265 [Serendipita sp. 396]|nr:hypothetical protein FRC14_004265 [Serendipita sp. 396]KAG8786957.1 hypothetical protein FRC15_010365 [Serendipita sp. 397]KAG8802176.1 hypothetical protein FRC16_010218 [Serendipita sp. 398]KAG8871294.1 hypothetical protein FRC20_010737 [Serendipita sp. 405]
MRLLWTALAASLLSGVVAENFLNFNATTPVKLGDPLQVAFKTEPDRFALIRLVVRAPNGTVSVAESRGNVNSTSTALTMGDSGLIVANNTANAPETRACAQMTGIAMNGTLTFIPDRVGTWRWTVLVEYYHGSQGYESDGSGNVCISPPFSRETLHVEPVSLQFIAEETIQPLQETVYSIDPHTVSVPATLSRNVQTTAALFPDATGTPFNRTTLQPTSSATTIVPSISYLILFGLFSFVRI